MKLSVIMPVYNEKSNIQRIIQMVMAVPLEKELIIIDDYSSDGTREILQGIDERGIRVVFHEKNCGKGASIQTGLRFARGDWVIIQDADLEYDPQDYLSLVKPLSEERAQVVYGSRFLDKGRNHFSFLQLVANRLLTALTNFLFGARLTDMETCYKVVPTSLMRELRLEAKRFEIELEITTKILKRNIPILEVPINYFGRNYQQGKKIKARDGLITLLALFKYRFIL